jgi:hypothetical protein
MERKINFDIIWLLATRGRRQEKQTAFPFSIKSRALRFGSSLFSDETWMVTAPKNNLIFK